MLFILGEPYSNTWGRVARSQASGILMPCWLLPRAILFLYLEQQQPDVHAIWFRHLHEPRWLPLDGVAFAAVEPTPMGFGLGAVDPGTPLAIGLDVARARCLERLRRGGR